MGKPKGSPKTGGRIAGTPNKLTGDIKGMILGALQDVGGREYLAQQALENPASFMTLVGRVMPLQLTGDPDNPVSYVVRAPSPVDSASEWLRLHAPSDSRAPVTIDADVDTDGK
jgi:hypothetical protein